MLTIKNSDDGKSKYILKFSNHTEEVFTFCKTVFGGESTAPGIRLMDDMRATEGIVYALDV